MSSDGPPWFVLDPASGEINILDIPERLQTHPDVVQRGIVLHDPVIPGGLYRTVINEKPYVVKILDLNTEELAIYRRLLPLDPASPNHTLPSEIGEQGHPLLIMPHIWDILLLSNVESKWTLYELLGFFLQVVEGVEFLHRQHIAHMDICAANVLVATPNAARKHKCLVSGKIYIIDFNSARQFALGPGEQPAIPLPPTQVKPPEGIRHFDPYSWDVFCIANVLEEIMKVDPHKPSPWIARRYVKWLIGKERGCTGPCRCRPTARMARQALQALRLVVYASGLCMRLVALPRQFLYLFLSRR